MINQWKDLKYYKPEYILKEFRKVEFNISTKILPDKVRNLRTNKLKFHKESRDAALFCYGMQQCVLKKNIEFSPFEDSDYDVIVRWRDDSFENYAALQLKEVVPKELNPSVELNDEIRKLKKYSGKKDLTVTIRLNQKKHLKFEEIIVPELNITELWIYGTLDLGQSKWFLYGNLLTRANYYEFQYP